MEWGSIYYSIGGEDLVASHGSLMLLMVRWLICAMLSLPAKVFFLFLRSKKGKTGRTSDVINLPNWPDFMKYVSSVGSHLEAVGPSSRNRCYSSASVCLHSILHCYCWLLLLYY